MEEGYKSDPQTPKLISRLSPEDDVSRHVAISLKVQEIYRQTSVRGEDTSSFLASDFDEEAMITFRFAAQAIIDQFLQQEGNRLVMAKKSEDPAYLMIREEIRERTDGIHTVVSSINEMLSIRSQIITAAISGVAISVFILIVALLPTSLDLAIKAWKHFFALG